MDVDAIALLQPLGQCASPPTHHHAKDYILGGGGRGTPAAGEVKAHTAAGVPAHSRTLPFASPRRLAARKGSPWTRRQTARTGPMPVPVPISFFCVRTHRPGFEFDSGVFTFRFLCAHTKKVAHINNKFFSAQNNRSFSAQNNIFFSAHKQQILFCTKQHIPLCT